MAELEVVPRNDEEQERDSRSGRARNYLRRNPKMRWWILVAAAVVIIGGVLVWRHYAVRESTDDAQIEGDIIPISARVGGTVKSVLVEDNQIVKAGDILVEIDPADYEVALKRAQADLADAGASAKAARSNVPITTTNTASQVENARAALAAAQQQVDAAQARLRE